MNKAITRIIEARDKGEKVIIYGDYDADGVAATSILFSFLSSIGVDVSIIFLTGLMKDMEYSEATARISLDGSFDLMLTVDCGISAKERIDYIVDKLAEKIVKWIL